MDSRRGDGLDDDSRWPWTHISVLDKELSSGNDGSRYCGGGGAGSHQFCAAPVYGHAVFAGSVSGGRGRRARVFDGDLDRKFVIDMVFLNLLRRFSGNQDPIGSYWKVGDSR